MAGATAVWALLELFEESVLYSSSRHLPLKPAHKQKEVIKGASFQHSLVIYFAHVYFNWINCTRGSENSLLTSVCCGGWDLSAAPACLWISPTLAAVRPMSCLQCNHPHTAETQDMLSIHRHACMCICVCAHVCTLLEMEAEPVPRSEQQLR